MTHLKAGDKAPDIAAFDQDGKPISLKDFKGKKVILYFYPKDDTPGCTAEACNLRDNYDDLLKKGFKIIGVSKDGIDSHNKFIKKYSLPFPLIPDTELKIIKDYGVWGEKSLYGKINMGVIRTTFVISGHGIIEEVFTKVDTKNHTQQILDAISI